MSAPDDSFAEQFALSRQDYVQRLDFFTWCRHYALLKDLAARVSGDVLEVGTGDGVLRRCAQPFVRSYTVMDVNPMLAPDRLADVREFQPDFEGRFAAAVASEVLEHLPFDQFGACIGNLRRYLRDGGLLFLTLPHRKRHAVWVSPGQTVHVWRFPVGLLSLKEAYHRFVRRRIWIDPHHCWEIGDGRVKRAHVQQALKAARLQLVKFDELPYCDYWLLQPSPWA